MSLKHSQPLEHRIPEPKQVLWSSLWMFNMCFDYINRNYSLWAANYNPVCKKYIKLMYNGELSHREKRRAARTVFNEHIQTIYAKLPTAHTESISKTCTFLLFPTLWQQQHDQCCFGYISAAQSSKREWLSTGLDFEKAIHDTRQDGCTTQSFLT